MAARVPFGLIVVLWLFGFLTNSTRAQQEVDHETSNLYRVVLIVLSILSFAYQGITYTTREKVIDIGPIEATVKSKNDSVASLSARC
jgi:hypothetical protein